MDEYHLLKKYNKRNGSDGEKKQIKGYIIGFINQVLICIVLFLVSLILTKNTTFKDKLYNYVYNSNLSFLKIEDFFEKKFGELIPSKTKDESQKVASNSKIDYDGLEEIDGGVLLTVKQSTLIKSLESGLVVFNGNKDGYGNVLILEQVDGVEVWYVNITSTSFNLYDYVEKGEILGESENDKIKLLFKNNEGSVDYKTYLF